MTDRQCLEKFLLDSEQLIPLEQWLGDLNIFEILKISSAEIRHSNFLAWLFTPGEGHGAGDAFLKAVLSDIIECYSEFLRPQGIDIFFCALHSFDDLEVRREWRNIDLLCVSAHNRFVLCIENKIFSSEHDNQLEKYRAAVEQTFPSFKPLFIFLTPDGSLPGEEAWLPFSYTQLLKALEHALSKLTLSQKAQLLIEDYIRMLRRTIVQDEEIVRLCNEIYNKHRRAIDLIIENRPDLLSARAEQLRAYCAARAGRAADILFSPDTSSKTCIRFTTPRMSRLLPVTEGQKSGWGTLGTYFYEIVNRESVIKVQLSLNSMNRTKDTLARCETLAAATGKPLRAGWQWRILASWKVLSQRSLESEDEDLMAKVYKRLDHILEKEIPEFEEKMETALRLADRL